MVVIHYHFFRLIGCSQQVIRLLFVDIVTAVGPDIFNLFTIKKLKPIKKFLSNSRPNEVGTVCMWMLIVWGLWMTSTNLQAFHSDGVCTDYTLTMRLLFFHKATSQCTFSPFRWCRFLSLSRHRYCSIKASKNGGHLEYIKILYVHQFVYTFDVVCHIPEHL